MARTVKNKFNHLYAAYAGPEMVVEEGSNVTLSGKNNYDRDGIELAYSWK